MHKYTNKTQQPTDKPPGWPVSDLSNVHKITHRILTALPMPLAFIDQVHHIGLSVGQTYLLNSKIVCRNYYGLIKM